MKTSVDKLDEIVESYINGNINWSMKEIKKLSRNDRARIVARFRCLVSTFQAFKIADRIIKNEY